MKENQTVSCDRKSNNKTFTVYFIKLYGAAGIQNIYCRQSLAISFVGALVIQKLHGTKKPNF